jgi:tocopherol cyclase
MTRPLPAPAGPSTPGWARRLPYPLRRVWQPEVYQGGHRHDDYFEGWYLKCVDASRSQVLALIPGISHDRAGGTSHSFVQVVRPGGRTAYLSYPADAFTFDRKRFAITVGPNTFSESGVTLDLDCDGLRLHGELGFGPWIPWPVSATTPGIMGPYRFVPRMEGYHGVCSLDHPLTGQLELDGERLDFNGGRGYAEKDWGRSFPSSWVWAQSNHFDRPQTSVTVSVARIPWMGSSFVGFIAGALVSGNLYRFTSYTGAKLTAFQSRIDGAAMTYQDHDFRLEVELDGAAAAPLKAPSHGRMVARADESLDATMRAKLTDLRTGEVLLDDCGLHAGCEVMDVKGELEAGVWRPASPAR